MTTINLVLPTPLKDENGDYIYCTCDHCLQNEYESCLYGVDEEGRFCEPEFDEHGIMIF